MTTNSDKLLKDIKAARDAVRVAKLLECTCSGFCLQYEGGCCCRRGEEVKKAEQHLKELLDSIT